MKQTLQKIKSVIMELHKTYPSAHDVRVNEPYVSRRRVIEEIEELEKELRDGIRDCEAKAMKFNLKNRPSWLDGTVKMKSYEEWFEGFEKELREILKEYYAFFRGGKARFRTSDELVKEILGDE